MKLAFLLFAGFGLKVLPQLNINAVHNSKTITSGIILTPNTMFMLISTFLLFLVSEVACREECAHFGVFGLYLPILSQIKKTFSKKSKCVHHPCTRHHLCAKFDVLRTSHS